MYRPYFRGKQFELLTVRETAALMAQAEFVPIIEPVREAFTNLTRALDAVCGARGKAVVIVNPRDGDHAANGDGISALLRENHVDSEGILAGILLKPEMTVGDALGYFNEHSQLRPVFIHAGFTDPRTLAQELGDRLGDTEHIFIDDYCGKPYTRHFRGSERVLIRDGFIRRKNADYQSYEKFSDLHVIYQEEGMDGFGDFLIVGDEYSEGGGPAYAIAIHITCIDPDRDDVMYVHHFVSTTNNTPTDPAGKFRQALDKLIIELDSGTSNILESEAITEFRQLHRDGHFPGLGYVKKLAMKHHIELLAHYLAL